MIRLYIVDLLNVASDTVVFPEWPLVTSYRHWRNEVIDIVCSASIDPNETIAWFRQTYEPGMTMDRLGVPQNGYKGTLETKIAVGLKANDNYFSFSRVRGTKVKFKGSWVQNKQHSENSNWPSISKYR